MRNRKELKLNSLSQSSLKEREMSKIYGGNLINRVEFILL